MNREEVREKRRELAQKEWVLYREYENSQDEEKKEILKEIEEIGAQLESCVFPRKRNAINRFWEKPGYKINKFDYIKMKLYGMSDLEISKVIKIEQANFSSRIKKKWKLPKIDNKVWQKYSIEDFEMIMEYIERTENGEDINDLLNEDELSI